MRLEPDLEIAACRVIKFFRNSSEKRFLPRETAIDVNCRFVLLSRSLGLQFLRFKSPLVLSPLSRMFVDFSPRLI